MRWSNTRSSARWLVRSAQAPWCWMRPCAITTTSCACRANVNSCSTLTTVVPLANLDPPHQADWLLTVRALVAAGTTVVSVLHELTFALHADDVVVMADGRISHCGACAERSTHRALERVFDQRIAIHAVQGQWVALPAWA